MSLSSSAAPDVSLESPTAPSQPPPRPFYWSVRRELWENRSIWIAPLVVAGVVLVGFPFSLIGFPARFVETSKLDPERAAHLHAIPYDFAAMAILLATLAVAVTYCLGALQGERRDRSLLFWKSLPVSDLTTVLAKASIPLIIAPLVVFVVVIVTQLIMLLISTVVQAPHGADAMGMVWARWPLIRMSFVLLYGLATATLWYAPIYGWLLLVSVWARRAPFLWAVLPPLALCLIEAVAFGTSNVSSLLQDRLSGSFNLAFDTQGQHSPLIDLSQIDPARFFSSLGLWAGLAVAAALIAAAVWLRRSREPT